MRNEHLYTIRWTQPYSTDRLRPYLRSLMEVVEKSIEVELESNYFPEAQQLIERIKNANKSN